MSSRVNEVNGENLQDTPPIKNPGYANAFDTCYKEIQVLQNKDTLSGNLL